MHFISFRKTIILLIVPQFVFIQWIKKNPEIIEIYYSNSLYQKILSASIFLKKFIFFSLGDIIYLMMFILLFYKLYNFFKKNTFIYLKFLTNTLYCFSIILFLFYFTWGLNYYRIPIADKMKINKDYSTSELISLTNNFINSSNNLHEKLALNENKPVKNNYSDEKIFSLINSNFKNLEGKKIQLSKINFSIYRFPLSYMGFSGYINPFTLESHLNRNIPKINKPITIAHEMSHQIGYAKENEANFIAFLNTYENNDNYIRYSAYVFALKYCLLELKNRNFDVSNDKLIKIKPGIIHNLKENEKFWNSYNNPFRPLLKMAYTKFLQINGQRNGIKSYNEVVNLLIGFYRIKK